MNLIQPTLNAADGDKRNIEKYDKAGPYDFDTSDYAERARWQDEIRNFLWDHWKGRRFGWLRATYYTKEGDSVATQYYVEPDDKNIWHIYVEEATNFRGARRGDPRRLGKNEYRIHSLKRLRERGGSYRLLFKNEKGERIGAL